MNLALGIVLYRDGVPLLLTGGHRRYQVKHELVIYFKIGDADGVVEVPGARAHLLKDLADSPRNEPSVFVVLHAAAHGKCLARTSLPID